MSYIRCLSNPESLYVIATMNDVEFIEGPKPILHVPFDVFEGLARKWYKNYQVPCSYKGFKVEETPDFRWRLSYNNWRRTIILYEVTLAYMWDRFRRERDIDMSRKTKHTKSRRRRKVGSKKRRARKAAKKN